MEEVINEVVSSDILKHFEAVYNKQVEDGEVTKKATFEYATCLVRSRYSADIRKGICLLESLYENGSEEEKRDYVYYLALGKTKIRDYSTALRYVKAFLDIEPANIQVQRLEAVIRKRMEKEGLVGFAIAGGAILAAGGLLTLGIALVKGSKS
ncbi:mitochondrial fission 1 protein [Cimex lectularius]|uniref:Mitochondrial fission 1 protein n=1 Tax=Cimex lectularius TaxID=79782 RepID=A0A8I6RQI3_CIMLE|nr:mitochondrial fission 1 protein [Cimex lectularius]XP_014249609.1 mitochondrial fission 1 protein [Cimex lectularius]